MKKATDFDLLRLFVLLMEEKGITRNVLTISVSQEIVDLMREKLEANCTLGELQRFADKCLAHEWLEHAYVSSSKYESLVLTTTGHGVVRSIQMKQAAKDRRSTLKRFSDFIEEHKGVMVVVTVLIAIIGLILKSGV